MRVLPRSLFGRLMLVLASGLVIAQLVAAAISLLERDSLLVRMSGMQPAQRIADIITLLDSLDPTERARVVAILNVPPLAVALDRTPLVEQSEATAGAHAAMFSAVLRSVLRDDRPIRVAIRDPSTGSPPGRWVEHGQGFKGPMGGPGMHRFLSDGASFLIQVRLRDGTWATFDTDVAPQSATFPWRVFLSLAMLLATVLLVSYIAVRWITRPLQLLATAADELGRDINRAPLPETGPVEVSRAARAFNTMQTRLVRFVDERTRLLTAMSHDLKTPLTRLRLRAELLDDAILREKFESDLLELDTMVTRTLEFMRGLGTREPVQLVDIMGLLQSMQADNASMGRNVTIHGCVHRPLEARAQLLKRCLMNLVDNAVLYGQRALIRVEEEDARLVMRVRDDGPGIPEEEMDKVFEPFYRIDRSRNRESGGTGLGLSIARNIARAHGGDVRLRNREGGGLEAVLTLPWRCAADATIEKVASGT